MTSTATQTGSSAKTRGPLKRTLSGVVTSDKRDKTRTVSVEYVVQQPKYGKYLRRCSRLHVHDPQNTSKIGDRVEIANCRPISKTKSWRLVRVIARGQAVADTKFGL